MAPNSDALVDAAIVEMLFDVPPPTLRSWAHRGVLVAGQRIRLQRRGTGKWGRALYRYGDVCDLVAATTANARLSTSP